MLELKSVLAAEKTEENNHKETMSKAGDFCSLSDFRVVSGKLGAGFLITIVLLELILNSNLEGSIKLHSRVHFENVTRR